MPISDPLALPCPPEALIRAATDLAYADEQLRHALVAARRAAGLSQRDVAAALGIKRSSVAAFERGDSDPRLSVIRRYALAVGVQVDHDVSVVGALASEGAPVAL